MSAGPGPHGAGAATDGSTDGWSWTGPARQAPTPYADVVVLALWVAVPAAALIPLGPEPLHLAVVLACIGLAVAAARWPRPLTGGLRLGPDGVSEWEDRAFPWRSRRATRVPAGEVATVEIDTMGRGLVLADGEGHALHHAPQDGLGDLVTTVLAARARGLSVAFLTHERGGSVDTSWIDRLEARLTEVVLEPPATWTAGSSDAAEEDSVRHPESPYALEAKVFAAVVAAAGTGLMVGLVSPALQLAGHATWSARWGAAAGGLMAAAGLWALLRGRARTAVCTWTVNETVVLADDTRRGRWEVPRERVAAALPVHSGGVPHVLLVDQLLRPVAEIPCVAPSVGAVARLLRRAGVAWVEPDRTRAADASRPVPPWRRAAPGGRLRVTREGLLWVDDLAGYQSVIVPAGIVTALRVTSRDGVPWLSAVVPADHVGTSSDPGAQSAELFVGPLAELATTRSRVAAEAAEAGLVLQDLELEVFREAVVAEESARERAPAQAPTGVTTRVTDAGQALVRDSLRTAVGTAALMASICLVVTMVLFWRAASVSSPDLSPATVLAVGAACAALVFVVCLPGDTLRVDVDRVALTSRSGRRTRWTVLRNEVSAVGWLRDEDRKTARLAFFDGRGIPVRSAHVPGAAESVERALAERGWPIGPARGPLAPPPEA